MAKEKRRIVIDDLYRIASIEDPRISPDGQWVAYVQVTVDRMDNGYKRHIWLAATDGGQPIQITRGGKDSQPRWSPDGTRLAFTSGRGDKPQIYVLPVTAPGGEPRFLTSMRNGATNPAWSPDGSSIAFLAAMNAQERKDEASGKEKPEPKAKFESKQHTELDDHEEILRWDPRPVWRIPYRAGTSLLDDRFAQVYVIATAEGLSSDEKKPRRLTDTDAHYDAPQWTPDGKSILTARASEPDSDEPWRSSSLYRLRVKDGKETVITGESHQDATPLPSPDGEWIAYLRTPKENMYSRVTRLAILPSGGGKPTDLTLAWDRTVVDFKWAPDSQRLIIAGASEGWVEIYTVEVSTGEVEKLIPGKMYAEGLDVGRDGAVAFAASTAANPAELFWQPRSADEPIQLTEANTEYLSEIIVQPTHEIHVKAHDGVTIQGWYILPVGYEKGKKYPLVLEIHGGPHVMWSPAARTMWHEWQASAARGYVVYFSNPRGGDGYGEPFQRAIHRAWGEADFPDLMAGVDAVIAKGFVDEKRMAVTGGSYGGFMTAWVVGHTNRFVAAFTQRGVYNLTSFYGTSDIPTLISDEFDVDPWDDPELLWKYSPLAYAHQIKTPIIIKAGENDFRVPIEQSEQLFALIRRSGGTVKFLRYARDGHELSRSGEPLHRVSRLTEMLAWFDKYTKPKKAR